MPAVILTNPDDPLFSFEHMMQHRTYFGIMGDHNVQGGLSQFSALPYLLDPSHNTDLPAQPWNLNHQQAHNDLNGDLPNNYNNGYTIQTITPPLITVIGNTIPPGTPLTTIQLTSVTPPQIIIGSGIIGFGVTITGQTSGTPGGDGDYTITPALNVTGAAMTVGHPPFQQATPIPSAGSFGIHQPGILLEGNGGTPENQTWWTFVNHQQHFTANSAVLPYPTTAPMTAGTGPGQVPASNPWWWMYRGPLIYPFW